MSPPRLLAILAHPDDESLGFGGTLATYAARGAETYLLTATNGEGGRYRGLPRDHPDHPGTTALAAIREQELRAAAAVLAIHDVALLGYRDGQLDREDPGEAVWRIAEHVRRVRPQVVITFGQDGSYGHPDHIAICQFATAGLLAAASVQAGSEPPHSVAKLYYIAWPDSQFKLYQRAFRRLTSMVDGVERQAVGWPEWAITTEIDTQGAWRTVQRAVSCHESQLAGYPRHGELSEAEHEALWSRQYFYRVHSLVNGGRQRERDLFEGVPAE